MSPERALGTGVREALLRITTAGAAMTVKEAMLRGESGSVQPHCGCFCEARHEPNCLLGVAGDGRDPKSELISIVVGAIQMSGTEPSGKATDGCCAPEDNRWGSRGNPAATTTRLRTIKIYMRTK